MAGRRALKILLLCAGLVALAKCVETGTTGTKKTQCPKAWTVTPTSFGFQMQLTSVSDGIYTVELTGEGTVLPRHVFNHSAPPSNYSEPMLLKFLKPCTTYKLNVTFIDTPTSSPCIHTEDIDTNEMKEDEIDQVKCGDPAHVCYFSDWDITTNATSVHLSCKSNKSYRQVFCIKPGIDYICSVLTINLAGNCPGFNLTRDITPDFLDPREIKQSYPTQLPVDIKWLNKPQDCKEDLSIDYTCKEPGKNNTILKILELEPYTNYTCTGQMKPNNIPTPDVRVYIDCGVRTTIINEETTGNSIKMKWTTNSSNCGDTEVQKHSYKCNCVPTATPDSGARSGEAEEDVCLVSGLEYFSKYECEVKPYYNNKAVPKPPKTTPKTIKTDAGNNRHAVIGILSFLILLTSVALLFVLYKIYVLHWKKPLNINDIVNLITHPSEDENLLNIDPIAAEVLLDSYNRKFADEARLLRAEFQSIPKVFTRNTVREAKKPCNEKKNRYSDILPYDSTRVQLTSGNGAPGCDYINASFIDGFKESKEYIAAQGPLPETTSDFWRMIWEQQSSIIVMVTRCQENKIIKCDQYWPSPEREAKIFEEFVVKLNGEDHCPDYIIRRLSLTNKRDKSTEREVTHIQFTSWPDHGVPEHPHLLLKLRRRVNSFKNLFSGPIVIHCSAGVGRTGTYISIDAMIEALETEGRVDIYGYIVQLRRQRCFMVQVEAQYILIHQALSEYNRFGETEIPLSELHSTLGALRQFKGLDDEFQRVPMYKNCRTFNTGITEENRKKNRVSSIIPYDFNRVLVKLDDSSHDSDHKKDEDESSKEKDEEFTKYINASHIDGYWCPRSFIAAQGPLPDTIDDFWHMVYQKKAKAIVMLSDCSEDDMETCSSYWGSEKKTFGDIEVEVTDTETSSTFTVRTMQIHHTKRKESRLVKQFHFLKWTSRELPEKPQDLTDMIKNIKRTCDYGNSKSDRSTPVVVHCSDGSSRSGVFCALWNLLDSAETEKLVDVFQVCNALRQERQDTITSLEQYHYLYKALEEAFPVQNGDVKAAAAVDVGTDSVQMVNEQVAAEITPLLVDVAKEEEKLEDEKEEGTAKEPATEKMPSEETSKDPIVTLEV